MLLSRVSRAGAFPARGAFAGLLSLPITPVCEPTFRGPLAVCRSPSKGAGRHAREDAADRGLGGRAGSRLSVIT